MTGPDMTGPDAASTDEGIDFFVSYTRSDEGWATWAAHKLELAGYRVLIQGWDFGTGNFLAHMEEAVQRSEWLLPIYSSAYLKSKYGRDEWTAYQRDDPARIIPIQVEEVSTRSLLATLVRIRLTGLGEQEAEKKLLAAMRKYVTPRYSPRDRMDGKGISFPAIAYGLAEDAESTHEINQSIDLIQAQVQGPRRDQWWAWADLGLVCQLGGRAREARDAYEHFQQAGARPVDYKSALDVLESLSATFEPSAPDLAARLGATVQTLQASSGGA